MREKRAEISEAVEAAFTPAEQRDGMFPYGVTELEWEDDADEPTLVCEVGKMSPHGVLMGNSGRVWVTEEELVSKWEYHPRWDVDVERDVVDVDGVELHLTCAWRCAMIPKPSWSEEAREWVTGKEWDPEQRAWV